MKVVQYQYLQKNNFRTCVSHVQICFSFEAKMHNCGFFRTHLRNCHNVFFGRDTNGFLEWEFSNSNAPASEKLQAFKEAEAYPGW